MLILRTGAMWNFHHVKTCETPVKKRCVPQKCLLGLVRGTSILVLTAPEANRSPLALQNQDQRSAVIDIMFSHQELTCDHWFFYSSFSGDQMFLMIVRCHRKLLNGYFLGWSGSLHEIFIGGIVTPRRHFRYPHEKFLSTICLKCNSALFRVVLLTYTTTAPQAPKIPN